MIPVKTKEEIAIIRDNGKITGRILRELIRLVKPGTTTLDINRAADELIDHYGVTAAFKGYRGFPATVCVSLNEEVVHGIPSNRRLIEGDIVSIDLGILDKGFYADAAITCGVGKISTEAKKLLAVTKKSLALGIKQAKAGNHLYDVSSAVQKFVETSGFSVVRQFVGHGIGSRLHEEPEIPNFGKPGCGPRLEVGMVLAIEPMVNVGSWETRLQVNGWTAVTSDSSLSAHFEHTIAITESGPEILTA